MPPFAQDYYPHSLCSIQSSLQGNEWMHGMIRHRRRSAFIRLFIHLSISARSSVRTYVVGGGVVGFIEGFVRIGKPMYAVWGDPQGRESGLVLRLEKVWCWGWRRVGGLIAKGPAQGTSLVLLLLLFSFCILFGSLWKNTFFFLFFFFFLFVLIFSYICKSNITSIRLLDL